MNTNSNQTPSNPPTQSCKFKPLTAEELVDLQIQNSEIEGYHISPETKAKVLKRVQRTTGLADR